MQHYSGEKWIASFAFLSVYIQLPKFHLHWTVFCFTTSLSVVSPRHKVMVLLALLIMSEFSFWNKDINMFISSLVASIHPICIKITSILILHNLKSFSLNVKLGSHIFQPCFFSFFLLFLTHGANCLVRNNHNNKDERKQLNYSEMFYT